MAKLHSLSHVAVLVRDSSHARVVGRMMAVALIGVALLTLGSCLLVAIAHIGGEQGVIDDTAPGIWLSLARYASHGTLFPPLFDGHVFGGTRYMPLPVLLIAGVERLTGDYVLAGKLISLILMAALISVAYLLLRRQRCPRALAIALASTLVATSPGLQDTLSIRNDVLPIILQIVALAIAGFTTRPRFLAAAGALCALAVAAKLSAVWAPLAIGVWLLVRNRRGLVWFIAALAGSLAILVALFELASHGRLTDNVPLMFQSSRGVASLAADFHHYTYLLAGLGPVRLLLAVATAATLLALLRRQATIYQLGLAAALIVLIPIATDAGTVTNHILDTHVLVLLVIGGLWADPPALKADATVVRWGLALCVLAAAGANYVSGLQVLGLRDGLRELAGRDSPPSVATVLERYVHPGDQILSENAYVPLILDQRPVVLDPFVLWSLAASHPAWRKDLVGRIDAHEFAAVFLFKRPETGDPAVRFWYAKLFFGPQVTAAIVRNYHRTGRVAGLWLYRPRA